MKPSDIVTNSYTAANNPETENYDNQIIPIMITE